MPTFKIETFGNRREIHPNQDRAFAKLLNDGNVVAGVFDGLGGPADGDIAATLVCDFVRDRSKQLPVRPDPTVAIKCLRKLFQDADKHLKKAARHNALALEAGTTGVLVFGYPKDDSATEWQIAVTGGGDSRAYVYLPSGILQPLSLDNTSCFNLIGVDQINSVLRGSIQEFLSSCENQRDIKTEQQRLLFTTRHIVDNAFFGDPSCPTTEFSVAVLNVPAGSRLLLMSDGVSDVLSDRTIQSICKESKPGHAAHSLIQEAADRAMNQTDMRGKEDDRTVVEVTL